MPTSDHIRIRDPFILTDAQTSTYYLYGTTDSNIWAGPATGFDYYKSSDLAHWEGPYAAFRPNADFWSHESYWAPEVHAYNGSYFMFATFTGTNGSRGTQILKADTPEGPFLPWSDGPVTPPDWHCLDGTLHVDGDGSPWLIFCHEWIDVHDGTILAQRLATDLQSSEGALHLLFKASEAPWTRALTDSWAQGREEACYVTDGPFLFTARDGALLMLWSSFGEEGYAAGIARSVNGLVTGPWVHEDEALWSKDGGHGMVVQALDGGLRLTFHQPNDTPNERLQLHPLVERGGSLRLQT